MPKKPMTKDEHAALGAELHAIRSRLQTLLMTHIQNRYAKNSRVTEQSLSLEKKIDAFRCALDSQAARDLGAQFDTKLYYPGTP